MRCAIKKKRETFATAFPLLIPVALSDGGAGLAFSVVIGKFLLVDPDTRNLSLYDDDEDVQSLKTAYHDNPVRAFFRARAIGHDTYPVLFQNEFKPTKL
eukprot:gene15201-21276_t